MISNSYLMDCFNKYAAHMSITKARDSRSYIPGCVCDVNYTCYVRLTCLLFLIIIKVFINTKQ